MNYPTNNDDNAPDSNSYGTNGWPNPYTYNNNNWPNSNSNSNQNPYGAGWPPPSNPYTGNWQNPNSNQNPYANYVPVGQYYDFTNPYMPQPVRRKSGGWKIFFLLVGMVVGMAWLSVNYLHGRAGTTDADREADDYGFTVQPNDPLFDEQYALQRINSEAAWSLTQGNSSLIVAVVDTGVDSNHPDLKGKLVKGYDFVNDDDTPEDLVGHGTFVASLIAARTGDGKGIVGIAPNVKIMPLKALGSKGGSSTDIAAAIRYATDNGAKVINLSLGSPTASRAIQQAVNYATGKGVVVVAASGNDGNKRNPVEYPAAFSNVISVGATGPRDSIATFSSHNKEVDISAPGVNVVGAQASGTRMCRSTSGQPYCTASGTSFAAPYVAGTAALMLSVNPKLTPAEVRQILMQTATDKGVRGTDEYYGAGLLNAGKAVTAAKSKV